MIIGGLGYILYKKGVFSQLAQPAAAFTPGPSVGNTGAGGGGGAADTGTPPPSPPPSPAVDNTTPAPAAAAGGNVTCADGSVVADASLCPGAAAPTGRVPKTKAVRGCAPNPAGGVCYTGKNGTVGCGVDCNGAKVRQAQLAGGGGGGVVPGTANTGTPGAGGVICKRGYANVGGHCVLNKGANLQCQPGYRNSGGHCVKIFTAAVLANKKALPKAIRPSKGFSFKPNNPAITVNNKTGQMFLGTRYAEDDQTFEHDSTLYMPTIA